MKNYDEKKTYHFCPKEKKKKIEKLVTSLCDKTEYIFTNRKLNISIKTRITLEKGSQVISLNQDEWLNDTLK